MSPTKKTYQRPIVAEITRSLGKGLPFLRILIGPRQTGKTTAALQVASRWPGEVVESSADSPLPPGPEWIQSHWETARRASKPRKPSLLILDEIQKVRGWSETVKALWDEDRKRGRKPAILLLGSSALLMHKGMTESLAGRFQLHRCLHWGWTEVNRAFGWSLDEWLFFGGYPGAAPLRPDEGAWRRYIADSLIETALSRDVLHQTSISKPALLRHLFGLAAMHPARIFSYNKMLGELQDAGNTTTLAHYLVLLEHSFLVSGLEIFRRDVPVKRGSSPKLVVWNNALVNALSGIPFKEARKNGAHWGWLVENAVGAYLLNGLEGPPARLQYWRHRNDEVDYILQAGKTIWAVEVKSGRPSKPAGLTAFLRRYKQAKPLIVGTGGMPLEKFFSTDPQVTFRP